MCGPITDPEKKIITNIPKQVVIGVCYTTFICHFLLFFLHRILLSMYVTCNIIDVIGLEDNCKLNEEEYFMW